MSIDYIITCLNHAAYGLALRRITRDEARAIQRQAMLDYEAWEYRICDDLKNRVNLLNNLVNDVVNQTM
jgi:hypothetical protein